MSQMIISNLFIKCFAIFMSLIGFCYSTYFVPKTIKIINKNTMPYHLEWLAQSLICFLIVNAYNLIFAANIVNMRPEYIKVLHWLVYISLIYFSLFTTKFVTKKCETSARLYTLFSQLIFGLVAIYAIIEVFISRMDSMYTPQNENVYTFIYGFKDCLFIIQLLASIIFCAYTIKKLKYRKSVLSIKIIIVLITAIFLVSYYITALFPIFFIIYEISTFICIQLTKYNVMNEGGRFLDD